RGRAAQRQTRLRRDVLVRDAAAAVPVLGEDRGATRVAGGRAQGCRAGRQYGLALLECRRLAGRVLPGGYPASLGSGLESADEAVPRIRRVAVSRQRDRRRSRTQ